METVETEEVGGGTGSGDRAFMLPRYLCNIVAKGDNGAAGTVDVRS